MDCYRFQRDCNGGRVFVTVNLAPVPVVPDRGRGVVGEELKSWQVPLETCGKTGRQAGALTGDAVAVVVEYARLQVSDLAYRSVLRRVKVIERYGLTVHRSAASVLARRLLGSSKRNPSGLGINRG